MKFSTFLTLLGKLLICEEIGKKFRRKLLIYEKIRYTYVSFCDFT